MKKIKPIIKWAGGKTFIIDEIQKKLVNVDISNSTFFEPFCGGLSISLAIGKDFKQVVANDTNSKLIDLYNSIKNEVNKVIDELELIEKKKTEVDYYKIRAEEKDISFNYKSKEYKAARFIYLNKLGYNGLYRENNDGYFNVPFGKRELTRIFDKENLLEVSNLFEKFEFMNVDFEDCARLAKKGDVVYFDPPYFPLNSTSFTKYTKSNFTLNDQNRLFKLMNHLSTKGVYVIISNSVTKESSELYKDWIKGKESIVETRRLISSKVESRNIVQEYLLDNIGGGNESKTRKK